MERKRDRERNIDIYLVHSIYRRDRFTISFSYSGLPKAELAFLLNPLLFCSLTVYFSSRSLVLRSQSTACECVHKNRQDIDVLNMCYNYPKTMERSAH